MSLFHVPFKSFKQQLEPHKKQYRPIVAQRNKMQDSLLQQLGVTLNISTYKKLKAAAWKGSQEKLKRYTQEKNKLIEEHKFLGNNSFKHWFFRFGLFTTLLYFTIKSLTNDLKATIPTGHQYASIGGISIAVFWLIHVLFIGASDYEIETYFFSILVISVLIGIFVFALAKYFVRKENIVKTLIALVVRLKQKHYRKVLVKALYADKHNKAMISETTLQEEALALDKDILTTINML